MAQAFCRSKDANQIADTNEFYYQLRKLENDIEDHTDHQEGNGPDWLKGDGETDNVGRQLIEGKPA